MDFRDRSDDDVARVVRHLFRETLGSSLACPCVARNPPEFPQACNPPTFLVVVQSFRSLDVPPSTNDNYWSKDRVVQQSSDDVDGHDIEKRGQVSN
ncbi:hypothetical protein BTHE68_63420 (plasmid) [Burkholderia sp. THE68]|nr:hypothetical protein BTHE68_63420 [Burkholderia sp. THE68]